MSENTDKEGRKDTESKILAEAEREFLTKGFSGARTTTIAESAGVTHAMLHYYFRTKEKLFDRIIADKVAVLKKALMESVTDISQPIEVIIRNVIDNHLDFISKNPLLPQFIIAELSANTERSAKIIEQIQQHSALLIRLLQNKIDEGVRKGKLRETNAGMLFLDIASLNIFPFLGSRVVEVIVPDIKENPERFIEIRKKENYDTIMRKILK